MSWAANKATQWAQAHSVPIAFATALGAPKGQHPGLGVACLALAAAWLVWARAGPGVVAHVSDIPVYMVLRDDLYFLLVPFHLSLI